MRILAFDTAGASCSVTLSDGQGAPCSRYAASRHGHGSLLAPMIDSVLRETDCRPAQIDRIAVNRGPGGFTGLRIALATARGWALVTGCPVSAVDSFELWLSMTSVGESLPVLVAVDSRRAEPFAQLHDGDRRVIWGPGFDTPRGIAGRIRAAGITALAVSGDAAGTVVPELAAAGVAVHESGVPGFGPERPPSERVAAIAADRPAVEGHAVEPLYIRAPDAKPAGAAAGGPVVRA